VGESVVVEVVVDDLGDGERVRGEEREDVVAWGGFVIGGGAGG